MLLYKVEANNSVVADINAIKMKQSILHQETGKSIKGISEIGQVLPMADSRQWK